jgi:hypothetical protein
MTINKWIDYDFTEHEVRMIMGDPVATAWEWLVKYSETISGTHWSRKVKPEALVETALNNLNKNGNIFSFGADRVPLVLGANTNELDPRFWDELEKFTQTKISQGKRIGFLYAH